MAIYFYYQAFGLNGIASYLLWSLAAITLHELAHGWAAIWQGDDTPRIYQRMTWNPLVHMGMYSVIMLLLVGIAWGVMPVDTSKFRWGRRGRIVVFGAGPAMNALLWLACWVGLGLLLASQLKYSDGSRNQLINIIRSLPEGSTRAIAIFLFIGGFMNGALALFNMLPIPPFDGASVVAGFSRRFYIWMHDPRVQQWGLLFVLVAMFSGIGGILSRVADTQGLRVAMLLAGG